MHGALADGPADVTEFSTGSGLREGRSSIADK
jgi:hypothetical protein